MTTTGDVVYQVGMEFPNGDRRQDNLVFSRESDACEEARKMAEMYGEGYVFAVIRKVVL